MWAQYDPIQKARPSVGRVLRVLADLMEKAEKAVRS
jgi:hypothetical protein